MKGFSRKNFKAWLESKPAEQIVGVGHGEDSCPIATFLKEKLNQTSVNVTRGEICFDLATGDYDSFETPNWVREFVNAVDEDFERGHSVSAGQSLARLR